jgi:hypothetical protein
LGSAAISITLMLLAQGTQTSRLSLACAHAKASEISATINGYLGASSEAFEIRDHLRGSE